MMKLVTSRFLPKAVEQTPAAGELVLRHRRPAAGGRLNHGSMKLKRNQNYKFSGNDTYENWRLQYYKTKKIAILLKYPFPMLSEQLPFTNSGRLAGWGRQVELGRLSLLPYLGAQPLIPSADEKSLLRRRNSALCVSSVTVQFQARQQTQAEICQLPT